MSDIEEHVYEMVFKTVLEQSSTVSLNTPDSARQLISRDFITWSVSEMLKRVERHYDGCQIRVTF